MREDFRLLVEMWLHTFREQWPKITDTKHLISLISERLGDFARYQNYSSDFKDGTEPNQLQQLAEIAAWCQLGAESLGLLPHAVPQQAVAVDDQEPARFRPKGTGH